MRNFLFLTPRGPEIHAMWCTLRRGCNMEAIKANSLQRTVRGAPSESVTVSDECTAVSGFVRALARRQARIDAAQTMGIPANDNQFRLSRAA
jgi:hypothetical protein